MPVAVEVAVLPAVDAAELLVHRLEPAHPAHVEVGDLAALAADDDVMRARIGPVLHVDEVEDAEPVAEIELGHGLDRLLDLLGLRRPGAVRTIDQRRREFAAADRRVLEADAEEFSHQADTVIAVRRRDPRRS